MAKKKIDETTHKAKALGGGHFEVKVYSWTEDAAGKPVQVLTATMQNITLPQSKEAVARRQENLKTAKSVVTAINLTVKEEATAKKKAPK